MYLILNNSFENINIIITENIIHNFNIIDEKEINRKYNTELKNIQDMKNVKKDIKKY